MRRVVSGHTAADRARVSPEGASTNWLSRCRKPAGQARSLQQWPRQAKRKQKARTDNRDSHSPREGTTAFAAHQIPLLQRNTAPDARKAKKHLSDKHASLFVLPKLPDQMFTTRAGKKEDLHARKNKGGKACGFDEFGTPQAEDVFFVPALPDRADLQMTDRVRK